MKKLNEYQKIKINELINDLNKYSPSVIVGGLLFYIKNYGTLKNYNSVVRFEDYVELEKGINEFLEKNELNIVTDRLNKKLIDEKDFSYSFSLSDGSVYYANNETGEGFLCNPISKEYQEVLINSLYSMVFRDLNNNKYRLIDVSEYGASVLNKELEDIEKNLPEEEKKKIKYGIEQVKYAIKNCR